MLAENVIPTFVSPYELASAENIGLPFCIRVGVVDGHIDGHVRHLHGCGMVQEVAGARAGRIADGSARRKSSTKKVVADVCRYAGKSVTRLLLPTTKS